MNTLTNAYVLYHYDHCMRPFDVSPEAILNASNIPLSQFKTLDGQIPLENFSSLLESSAHKTGCQHFGLLLAKEHHLSTLGINGLLLEKSQNLRTALKNSIKYFPLHSRGGTLRLEESKDLASLSYSVKIPSNSLQLIEYSLLFCINVIKDLIGSQWKPRSVHMKHSPLSHQRLYQSFFGAPIIFNSDMDAIILDTESLDTQTRGYDEIACHILANTLSGNLKKLAETTPSQSRTSISEQIEKTIEVLLAEHNCTLIQVANIHNMSPRKLQYVLEAEDTKFGDLVEKVRLRLACQYLRRKIPPSKIYPMLGYTSQASFSRAFRRNTGLSPREWEKQKSDTCLAGNAK